MPKVLRRFEIGDKVEVVDEPIAGTVEKIEGPTVTITTSDGFSLAFEDRQLVKVAGTLRVTDFDIAQGKVGKEPIKRKKDPAVKKKARNAPKMVVDLHIHQLTDKSKRMSNFDMLNLQLDTAKRQLEFAIRKRIQKVVFIHGVGEGVLKEELRYLFGRYAQVKFYDADFSKYGLGATEVYIFQNA